MTAPIVGKGNARVTITTEPQETRTLRSGTRERGRIILMDEEGRGAILDLDKHERNALRRALDELGPGDHFA